MILPIVAYGDTVLRKKAARVEKDQEGLDILIDNMFETMYNSHGVGLAAPQVGKSLQLFVIDTTSFEDEKYPSLKKVFINPEILEETGDKWEYEEGCLSIPHIRENVKRHAILRIRYQDEHFNTMEEQYDGMAARVIQHEYDHCQGILFVDHLSELKKRLLKNKLLNISKGNVEIGYRMRFAATR